MLPPVAAVLPAEKLNKTLVKQGLLPCCRFSGPLSINLPFLAIPIVILILIPDMESFRFLLSGFASFAYFVVIRSGLPSPVFHDLSVFVLFLSRHSLGGGGGCSKMIPWPPWFSIIRQCFVLSVVKYFAVYPVFRFLNSYFLIHFRIQLYR